MPQSSATQASAIIPFGRPLYLVKMNLTRTDPLLPVDQLTELIWGAILPSVESLTKLQAQGNVVSGGYATGRPAIVLLVVCPSGSRRRRRSRRCRALRNCLAQTKPPNLR
jgi:hypothetical protein